MENVKVVIINSNCFILLQNCHFAGGFVVKKSKIKQEIIYRTQNLSDNNLNREGGSW